VSASPAVTVQTDGLAFLCVDLWVTVDRGDHVRYVVDHAASDTSVGGLVEEQLDEVHPRGTRGGGEVQASLCVVVVEEQVDLQPSAGFVVDRRRTFRNSVCRWRGGHSPITEPVSTSTAVAADGFANTRIAKEVVVSPATVTAWRERSPRKG
jgi:hypothetical protein